MYSSRTVIISPSRLVLEGAALHPNQPTGPPLGRRELLARMDNGLMEAGFDIEYPGFRRMWLRMLIAPLLVIRRSLKLRRLVLYDAWDLTGSCYVIRAVRRTDA